MGQTVAELRKLHLPLTCASAGVRANLLPPHSRQTQFPIPLFFGPPAPPRAARSLFALPALRSLD
jgi:hypothetical protein